MSTDGEGGISVTISTGDKCILGRKVRRIRIKV